MAEAVFCHSCGHRLAEAGVGQEVLAGVGAPVEPGTGGSSGGAERFRQLLEPRGDARQAVEEELWQGSYSPKAMYATWVLCGLISVAAITLAVLFLPGGLLAWAIALGIVLLVWLVPLALLVYRRLSVEYRLTNQRFFHKHGILYRVTDRIEMIDMDDIRYEQGPVERMTGVGTLRITSSDRSHPELVLKGIENVAQVATLLDEARRAERIRRGVFVESI